MATDKLAIFMYGWIVGAAQVVFLLIWLIKHDTKNWLADKRAIPRLEKELAEAKRLQGVEEKWDFNEVAIHPDVDMGPHPEVNSPGWPKRQNGFMRTARIGFGQHAFLNGLFTLWECVNDGCGVEYYISAKTDAGHATVGCPGCNHKSWVEVEHLVFVNETGSGAQFIWRCENQSCGLHTYISQESRGDSYHSKLGCPDCGTRSSNKTSEWGGNRG